MSSGTIAAIIGILVVGTVLGVAVVAGVWAVRRGRRAGSKAGDAATGEVELHAVRAKEQVSSSVTPPGLELDIDTDELTSSESLEVDLANVNSQAPVAACSLCGGCVDVTGMICRHRGWRPAEDSKSAAPISRGARTSATGRFSELQKLGEIFVTAADVSFRCHQPPPNQPPASRWEAAAKAAQPLPPPSFFFYRGSGGGDAEPPQMLERIGQPAFAACIAALPGHDYHAWSCPAPHPAMSPPCPRCHRLISFRLMPNELVLLHCTKDSLGLGGGGGCNDIWVSAINLGDGKDNSEEGGRPPTCYEGPLMGLKRLKRRGAAGQLSLQLRMATTSEPTMEEDEVPEKCESAAAEASSVAAASVAATAAERDLASSGAAGLMREDRTQLGPAAVGGLAYLPPTEHHYPSKPWARLPDHKELGPLQQQQQQQLIPDLHQWSSSNRCSCMDNADPTGEPMDDKAGGSGGEGGGDDFIATTAPSSSHSDCDAASSSTMSAQTGDHQLSRRRDPTASAAKWAALGMQEVAGLIESSSSDSSAPFDAPDTADPVNPEGAQKTGDIASAGRPLASAEQAIAVASAAKLAAADAMAAIDRDYLRFLYCSDDNADVEPTAGAAAEATAADDADGDEGDSMAISTNPPASGTSGTDFYSAESNFPSPSSSITATAVTAAAAKKTPSQADDSQYERHFDP